MQLNRTETQLFEAMADMEVIDAHEHLVPEAVRVARRIDFFMLFSHYVKADLHSAGMPDSTYQRLAHDEDMAVQDKWAAFAPFYQMIKHGAYARPGRIWLEHVLGESDLTERNFLEVSERLQAENRPGLYHRVMRDMCHIEAALVDNEEHHAEYDMDLLKPLWRVSGLANEGSLRNSLLSDDGSVPSLDAFLDGVDQEGGKRLQIGAFGVKMVCFPFERADLSKAEAALHSLRGEGPRGAAWREGWPHVRAAAFGRVFKFARAHSLTVACHSGVWGDFRGSHPCHLIAMAQAFPDVSFDLFHLGMPFTREAILIGKMFPNVSTNLCWTSVYSPELTVRMLDECIDTIPLNNIIAFGADYRLPVEKVYGHLIMAKEAVARTLGKRIDRAQMDAEEAMRIARLWFCENPKRIYGI